MKKILFSIALACTVFIPLATSHAVSFAPNDPGTDISRDQNGYRLGAGYEPSGIVWHNRLQSLFLVSDDGRVTQTDIDGNIIHPSVQTGGLDLEDITIVDEQSNLVYLLQEFPQAIVEYDISSSTLTGRRWTLLGMPGDRTNGAEALTYNRATHEFYVGAQSDGNMYVYTVDLTTPENVNFSRRIVTGIRTDIAGLNYSDETRHIYALFDSANILQEYDSHDTLVAQFDVPGVNQEGLVILPGCPNATAQIIIAEDEPSNPAEEARVMKYGSYPLSCIPSFTDDDRDGYMADVDCRDNNAAVHPDAIEILNDGINNDCSTHTPDSVLTYNSATLLHPFATELRNDYHVFDNLGEYSYIRIPARFHDTWYSFELEARTNSLDQLYSMAVYAPFMNNVFAPPQLIQNNVWKTYTYTLFVPSHNNPIDIHFVSNVTGKRNIGGKREHHLRTVKVTRLEQIPNPLGQIIIGG